MTNENEVPPKSFLLCPYGEQHYTKDGKENAFSFSPESADRVIREFHSRARDLVIDYEHQTLTGEKAPAAGWIGDLEKTEEGLVAKVNYWTDAAADLLQKREYRYFSPTFLMSGNEVAALHSVALTNHPAMHGVTALAAKDTAIINQPENPGKTKGNTMNKTELALRKLLGDHALALSDETDSLTAARIEALAEELPELREKKNIAEEIRKLLGVPETAGRDEILAALKAELEKTEKLEADAEEAKKDLVLSDALAKNKITAAEKSVLAKLDLATLNDLVNAKTENSAVPGKNLPEPDKKNAGEKTAALTDEEKKIALSMGLTEEEFAEAKKEGAKENE